MVDDSILNGTKRALGIEPSYTQFDPELIMHINSAFGLLNRIGVGPLQGFYIEDASSTWDSFLKGDMRFNPARQYVYQKVRLAFDPPNTSFVIASMEKNIEELTYTLNLARENAIYGIPQFGVPDTGSVKPSDGVYDGGTPSGGSTSSGEGVYDGGTPDGNSTSTNPDPEYTIYDGGSI